MILSINAGCTQFFEHVFWQYLDDLANKQRAQHSVPFTTKSLGSLGVCTWLLQAQLLRS